MLQRNLLSLVFVLLVGGCAPTPGRWVDLTYSFDEQTVYWPNNEPFAWHRDAWGLVSEGYWYAAGSFSAAEHGGTHMDAPIHFAEARSTVDEIPVERLVGTAVVVNVTHRCSDSPDYEVTVDDVRDWEGRYGRIPRGAIVLLHTGWGRFWPDHRRYLGTSTPQDARTFHFPGLSHAAAVFLASERHVAGVGIDTASIDPGRSLDFPVHRVLNGANIYVLENVAELDRLPPRGATIVALPMKIRGGTGGPVRIIASLP